MGRGAAWRVRPSLSWSSRSWLHAGVYPFVSQEGLPYNQSGGAIPWRLSAGRKEEALMEATITVQIERGLWELFRSYYQDPEEAIREVSVLELYRRRYIVAAGEDVT